MSSSDVNVYYRSEELSCMPVTLAHACVIQGGIHTEINSTENNMFLAEQMNRIYVLVFWSSKGLVKEEALSRPSTSE